MLPSLGPDNRNDHRLISITPTHLLPLVGEWLVCVDPYGIQVDLFNMGTSLRALLLVFSTPIIPSPGSSTCIHKRAPALLHGSLRGLAIDSLPVLIELHMTGL